MLCALKTPEQGFVPLGGGRLLPKGQEKPAGVCVRRQADAPAQAQQKRGHVGLQRMGAAQRQVAPQGRCVAHPRACTPASQLEFNSYGNPHTCTMLLTWKP